MADTNKDNILTLAPELTSFVQNTRQSCTVTVNTAVDSRDYILTVEDVDYTIDSGVGATVISIAAALKVAVDLASLGLNIVDNGDGSLTITAENAGIRFNINSDLDYYITTTIDVNAGLGDNLLRLVLEDVQYECPYSIYKEEQERAQRYLAAHLLTVLYETGVSTTGTAGDIIREKVGDVETWYSDGGASTTITTSDSDLRNSKYGRAFLGIKSRHSVRFI